MIGEKRASDILKINMINHHNLRKAVSPMKTSSYENGTDLHTLRREHIRERRREKARSINSNILSFSFTEKNSERSYYIPSQYPHIA